MKNLKELKQVELTNNQQAFLVRLCKSNITSLNRDDVVIGIFGTTLETVEKLAGYGLFTKAEGFYYVTFNKQLLLEMLVELAKKEAIKTLNNLTA